MENGRFRDRKWYPYAVAACVGVAFYVLLAHLGAVSGAIGTFVGYFRTVIFGAILAYLIAPLARWYEKGLLRGVLKDAARWPIAVVLALLTALVLLALLLGMLIPQLAQSIATFAGNIETYAASLKDWLTASGLPLSGTSLDPERFAALSENLTKRVVALLSENAGSILGVAAGAGKGVFTWVVALILSVYLLMAKSSVKAETLRFLRAALREKRAEKLIDFFRRCDAILVSFVVDSLLESLIVGTANAVFMAIFGMQYVGLISVVVAVTNLIPTFGPIVGGVIGAFILLLINPVHALIFIVFTFALQFVDGYIIKPKLFGDALGVSGLLILIAVIVGGNMFGILGVLLAIPGAAILSFIYQDYLMPALERRR